MKHVLFMIPNLGRGGAEKVLVNLVNHLDQKKFKITVMTLYDEGVNKQFLATGIEYKSCFKRSFPGISHLLKIFTPKQLYRLFIKDSYDVVVSYLEGQTARIISGCDQKHTKKYCWIHRTYTEKQDAARLFRSEKEAEKCYESFDKIVSVSEDVQNAFMKLFPLNDKGIVLYNTNETDKIIKQSLEPVKDTVFLTGEIKLCAMGSLIPVKGFERLIEVHSKIKKEGFPIHTYILGEGSEKEKLETLIKETGMDSSITMLGYRTNPYSYMKNCDIFVCSSYSEGFSTAVTEALILGMSVITTQVSGMRELLENNEYGIIVKNDNDELYKGIKRLIEDRQLIQLYKNKALIRGKKFSTDATVKAVEKEIDFNIEGTIV